MTTLKKSVEKITNSLAASYFIVAFILVALLVLWSVIRFAMLDQQQPLISDSLIYYTALCILFLLCLYGAVLSTGFIRDIKSCNGKIKILIPWFLFLMLAAAILYLSSGFQIASIGLISAFSGMDITFHKSSYLLFKLYGWHPVLPVIVLIGMAAGYAPDYGALSGLLFSGNTLIAWMLISLFFSFVLCIFLKGRRGIISSLSLLLILTFAWYMSEGKHENIPLSLTVQLILITVSSLFLALVYGFLRKLSYSNAGVSSKSCDVSGKGRLTPPGAVALLGILFIAGPVIGDVINQGRIERSKRELVQETKANNIQRAASMNKTSVNKKQVAAVILNVRRQPSAESSKVRSLSIGEFVNVYEMRDGWARIGSGQWVFAKYLKNEQEFLLLSGGRLKMITSGRNLYLDMVLGLFDATNKVVIGKYKYEKQSEWLILKGGVNRQGDLVLGERTMSGQRTGSFVLHGTCVGALSGKSTKANSCSLKGVWKSPGKEVEYRVVTDRKLSMK